MIALAGKDSLDILVDTDCLVLLANSDGAIALDQGAGAVIGTLFSARGDERRVRSLDPLVVAQLLEADTTGLTRDYWGSYVAIVQSAGSGAVTVFRDPSASLPCYYQSTQGLTFISSHVDLLFGVGAVIAEVDWGYVAGHLLFTHLRPQRTGLRGVRELLGGYRLDVHAGDLRERQVWSPWTFADRGMQIAEEVEATTRVQETVARCVRAWASCFQHVVLGISGGLDSSIIAACLAKATAHTSCLTLVTDDPAGDERFYARLVAAALDLPLFEEFEDITQIDLDRSDAAHLPRPVARSFAQSGDRLHSELTARVGADAFFSGGGGDNVFCYLQSAAPIADRLLMEGIGAGAWRTSKDVSILTESSFLKAASLGLRRAWLRPPQYRWPENRSFLSAHAVASAGPGYHPWLDAPPGALPGKAAHIAWVMGIQNHLEGYGRELSFPKVSPLMSQPVVELCLQIPSWMWCAGGRNRAIARRAFASDLPPAIIERRSKGTPGSFIVEIFEANRAKLRDMVCGGVLARQGLLDIDLLQQVLIDPRPARGGDYSRIMAIADTEVWARSWISRSDPAKRAPLPIS